MLECVVEHRDRGSFVARTRDSLRAIRLNDYRHRGIEPGVYEWLVITIPAQHDGRPSTPFDQLSCNPCRHRRLPRTTDGYVADTTAGRTGSCDASIPVS